MTFDEQHGWVEGDTLRIVHTATMPLPAQIVNVTMTIGGE